MVSINGVSAQIGGIVMSSGARGASHRLRHSFRNPINKIVKPIVAGKFIGNIVTVPLAAVAASAVVAGSLGCLGGLVRDDIEETKEKNLNKVNTNEGIVKTKLKELEQERPELMFKIRNIIKYWIAQFESKEDVLLALRILKSFIYISTDNARDYLKILHEKLLEKPEFDMNKTQFSYFGHAKSGSIIANLYSQGNYFREKGVNYKDPSVKSKFSNFYSYDNKSNIVQEMINKNLDTIVFVDDMIDNGNSIKEFLNTEAIMDLKKLKKVYFITLLENKKGSQNIKEILPNAEFISYKEIKKYDDPNCFEFTEEEKQKISDFILKYSKKINLTLINKFKNSKIFVTYDWNTPGNTPMLFSLERKNWMPLFKRYNGLP